MRVAIRRLVLEKLKPLIQCTSAEEVSHELRQLAKVPGLDSTTASILRRGAMLLVPRYLDATTRQDLLCLHHHLLALQYSTLARWMFGWVEDADVVFEVRRRWYVIGVTMGAFFAADVEPCRRLLTCPIPLDESTAVAISRFTAPTLPRALALLAYHLRHAADFDHTRADRPPASPTALSPSEHGARAAGATGDSSGAAAAEPAVPIVYVPDSDPERAATRRRRSRLSSATVAARAHAWMMALGPAGYRTGHLRKESKRAARDRRGDERGRGRAAGGRRSAAATAAARTADVMWYNAHVRCPQQWTVASVRQAHVAVQSRQAAGESVGRWNDAVRAACDDLVVFPDAPLAAGEMSCADSDDDAEGAVVPVDDEGGPVMPGVDDVASPTGARPFDAADDEGAGMAEDADPEGAADGGGGDDEDDAPLPTALRSHVSAAAATAGVRKGATVHAGSGAGGAALKGTGHVAWSPVRSRCNRIIRSRLLCFEQSVLTV